jgi:hypothetical protein
LENIAKKQHADVQAYPMDEDTSAMLNAPNNALISQFIHQHPMGPIIWEQTWYEQDAYYCENNIITTNIFSCANNFSAITSTTSGEAAEEYLSEYMVKEKASLKQAVPSLLAALDQIIAHLSKAEDTWSIIWTGTSREGLRRRGSFIWFRGKWGVLEKKGVTLHGLRISKKKEILRKLTVFNDGGNSNCRSLLSHHLASIQGPSLLNIEL